MKLQVLVASLLVQCVLNAQERIDHDTYWKIRQEATTNSQVLKIAQVLTDLYGPRPTGSPNLKAAEEWAIKQHGVMGVAERPARAVGLGQSRLAQRAPLGSHCLARQGSSRGRSAGLDTRHQRARAGRSGPDHAAGPSHEGGSRGASGRAEEHREGEDRSRGRAPARAGHFQRSA